MTLYKRPGSENYWVTFKYKGRKIQRSTGTASKREAEAFERRLRAEVEAQNENTPALTPTLAVLRDLDVQRLREEGRNEAYITRGVINNYKWLIQYFADVSKVTDDSLVAYVKHRRALGIKRQTIAKELVCLKRGFRLARLPGPMYWPKLSRDPKDAKRSSKQHSATRWGAWLKSLENEAYDVAVFALLTGMRREEIYRATLDDLAGDVLTVHEKVKRPVPRRVVLVGPALEIAKRALPFKSDHKKAHKTAAKAAGGTTGNITLRDCRAAFATAGDKAGDSRATDMVMGHSGVPARYQKSDYDRLRAVADAAWTWLRAMPLTLVFRPLSWPVRELCGSCSS